MQLRNLGLLVAVITCVAVAGCATSRSEIKLKSPAASAVGAAAAGRAVYIRSVADERVFEQAPADPSIPSLGFEGAAQASAEIKARAIGRKRNGFGKALGDVLLQDGQTVPAVIRESLTAALVQAGFNVRSGDPATDPAALVLDVNIKKFWAWFRPGFWAITLNADVSTALSVVGGSAPVVVSVHVEDKRQLATEGAWIEIVDQALSAYRVELAAKADQLIE